MRKESIYKEFDSLYRQYTNEIFYSRGLTQEPHMVRNVNIDLLRDKGKCFDMNLTKNKRTFYSKSDVSCYENFPFYSCNFHEISLRKF
jgi:hypothetical protein